VIEIRTDSLSSLRELGPPDLIHLVKQPTKSTVKQVRATGIWPATMGTLLMHCD
jgi:Chs5-Arf1p-binding protein BUD7/BCH1